MSEETRMVDTYEIKHGLCIGSKEILFGVDETKADSPYMVCECTWDDPSGIGRYVHAVGSTDYLEMMTEFLSRAEIQLDAIKAEQVQTPIPLFTSEHCTPNDYSQSIENKVVVIRPDRLRPEYRTAVHQLMLATGGFGTYGNARGRAVYAANLYSGKESRWNREDIMGVIKDEFLPDWARERLETVQAERVRAAKNRDKER